MFKEKTIEELMQSWDKGNYTLIDVRSPSEYKEMTIPGSINIPIFDDEQRAEVGTLYKRVSVEAAKERGLEIVSAKLPEFIKQIGLLDGEKVVFCWRGGMRSKTAATVTDLMGIEISRLEGGVRSYRQWILEKLENLEIKPKAIVLNGGTGIGKTMILKMLQAEGYPAIDLEGMANHRGSVFGQIGLEGINQKTFDSLLVYEIIRLQSSPFILFEAESKRIGRIVVPDFVMEKKDNGTHIFIEMPIEERVRNIIEDYRPQENQEKILQAFRVIKKHIHTPVAAQIEADLIAGNFNSAVQLLLEHYYDSRYLHTVRNYTEKQMITIRARNTEEALIAVKDVLKKEKSGYTISS